jgi:hypothetical protein
VIPLRTRTAPQFAGGVAAGMSLPRRRALPTHCEAALAATSNGGFQVDYSFEIREKRLSPSFRFDPPAQQAAKRLSFFMTPFRKIFRAKPHL